MKTYTDQLLIRTTIINLKGLGFTACFKIPHVAGPSNCVYSGAEGFFAPEICIPAHYYYYLLFAKDEATWAYFDTQTSSDHLFPGLPISSVFLNLKDSASLEVACSNNYLGSGCCAMVMGVAWPLERTRPTDRWTWIRVIVDRAIRSTMLATLYSPWLGKDANCP